MKLSLDLCGNLIDVNKFTGFDFPKQQPRKVAMVIKNGKRILTILEGCPEDIASENIKTFMEWED